ncbi:Myb family transcription factor APL [Hordeum vulgare]|nr:Myb family transcription factor APL [Hordeum vulgare]
MCSMQAEHCQYMTEPEQMYHQQQQQFHDHSQHMSSRPSLSPETKFFMKGQGGAGGGDSGLILSTDAKPRLKWTPELHERFADAVKKLGGPDKATPKAIMRVMGIPGLTLYHLKSHLQKFRLSKNLQTQANAVHAKNVYGFGVATDKACEGRGSPADHLNRETNTSRSMHINDALQMQIEVQRRLHEQIEVQRHLQLRIEAQGKYLHSVLEKAQEALGKQHAVAGLEAAEPPQRLPELPSSVRRGLLQNDGSADDSCLTASEDILSMGLAASATRRGCGAPFETSASASREEDEECYLFLGKPEGRREVRRDGCNAGAAFGAVAELDLSIGGVAAGSRRRPDGGQRLDLNGSGWD